METTCSGTAAMRSGKREWRLERKEEVEPEGTSLLQAELGQDSSDNQVIFSTGLHLNMPTSIM